MATQSDFPVTIGSEKTFITTVIQDGEKLSRWMAILTPKGLKKFRIDELGFDINSLSLEEQFINREKYVAKYISENYNSFEFFYKKPNNELSF